MLPEAYVGIGSGTRLVIVLFWCMEGVHQGAIECGRFFSIGVNRAFQNFFITLSDYEGGVTVITDDNYIMGPLEQIFAAKKAFAEDLLEAGVELQPAKSQCYIAEPFWDAEWDTLRGDIPNGVLKNLDSETVTLDDNAPYGITVCNVPISKESFVKGYMDQRKIKITQRFNKMTTLLDPGRWPHPEMPSRQILWILTVISFQLMGDYWL